MPIDDPPILLPFEDFVNAVMKHSSHPLMKRSVRALVKRRIQGHVNKDQFAFELKFICGQAVVKAAVLECVPNVQDVADRKAKRVETQPSDDSNSKKVPDKFRAMVHAVECKNPKCTRLCKFVKRMVNFLIKNHEDERKAAILECLKNATPNARKWKVVAAKQQLEAANAMVDLKQA